MNRRFHLVALLPGILVQPVLAEEPARNPNRYSANGRFTFNVRADFTSSTPANSIGPAGVGAVNRTYDDGSVRVDISGNAGGMTTFWGYQDASQLAGIGTAAGTISFHSAPSPADQATLNADDEVLPGFDFKYGRDLGHFEMRVMGKERRAYYGINLGFGYTDLGLSDSHSVTAPVTLTTDTYAIGALIPPVAPFQGTFTGPGPLIPDTPAGRAVTTPTATSQNANDIDGRMFGFTLGPYLEIPLNDRFSTELNGGLALAYADREYSFRESVGIAGVPTTRRSGSISSADWLLGGVFNARLNYRRSDRLDYTLGFQYQNLGNTAQSVGGKTAEVDLSESVAVTFGFNWRF